MDNEAELLKAIKVLSRYLRKNHFEEDVPMPSEAEVVSAYYIVRNIIGPLFSDLEMKLITMTQEENNND